jgi:hypothetical protein
MQTYKLKMHIRNLEGLVNAFRSTGQSGAADQLEMEINFIKQDMEGDERDKRTIA